MLLLQDAHPIMPLLGGTIIIKSSKSKSVRLLQIALGIQFPESIVNNPNNAEGGASRLGSRSFSFWPSQVFEMLYPFLKIKHKCNPVKNIEVLAAHPSISYAGRSRQLSSFNKAVLFRLPQKHFFSKNK